jgi:tRNA A-37 threonylcarbamoyl transferase component Bud32
MSEDSQPAALFDLTGLTLGKYRLVEKLGQGGMAQVYKAYQTDLDRYVAVKVLHPHLVGDEDFVSRFRREARVVAALEHPHIVRVYDFDADGGVAFLVMERLEGRSLKAVLRELDCRDEKMPLEEVARVVGAVADALDYAHRQGLVHRDAACGVTSFYDNNVRGVDTVATYLDVGKQGKMFLRGAVYYTLEWPTDLDRALHEMEHDYADDFMRFAGFKFLLDGQLAMAYCHAPHNGERWDMPTWDPQGFKDAVRALHDTGLQICVHCVGDAAVDLTLDAYEEAMDANPRPDPRHRIEHAVITTPQATQRMCDLVVCQASYSRYSDEEYVSLCARFDGAWTGDFLCQRLESAWAAKKSRKNGHLSSPLFPVRPH